MLQRRRRLDLLHEALGAKYGGQLGLQQLKRDSAIGRRRARQAGRLLERRAHLLKLGDELVLRVPVDARLVRPARGSAAGASIESERNEPSMNYPTGN